VRYPKSLRGLYVLLNSMSLLYLNPSGVQ
jgi:hypothetical protein